MCLKNITRIFYDLPEDSTDRFCREKPGLFRFYTNLEYYRRLQECREELEAQRILRSRIIISGEFEHTRPMPDELLKKKSVFIPLSDGDGPLPACNPGNPGG